MLIILGAILNMIFSTCEEYDSSQNIYIYFSILYANAFWLLQIF